MEVVTFDMELDMSADDYDEEAMIAELAAYYGVDPSLISLEAEPITERRRLATHVYSRKAAPRGQLKLDAVSEVDGAEQRRRGQQSSERPSLGI